MKIFLIALDGASPDLIDRWTEKGKLPNLAKIKEDGLSGPLESTFPPLTGPAWSSFQTGVNPGKHGVFNWLDLKDSYRGEVVNYASISGSTIWDLVSSNGGRVGSLSVPMTYPPPEVNGFVVPGFLAPSDGADKTYPSSVLEEINNVAPEYQFLPPLFLTGKSRADWIEELKEAVRARGKVSRYLYEQYLSSGHDQLLAVHYFATDLVQHALWSEEPADWDPRLEVFKAVDDEIGKLMDRAPSDSVFLVISDHGFGPINQTFHVNNWLRKEGYLTLKTTLPSRIKRALFNLGFTEHNLQDIGKSIYPILRRLGLIDDLFIEVNNYEILNQMFLSDYDVNWDKTVAYSRSDIGNVRINLEGREKEGIVSEDEYLDIRREIIEKLRSLDNPKTGEPLAEWVEPKEEFYQGSFLDHAPDVLFNTLNQKTLSFGASMFRSNEVFGQPDRPGHHRRDGILLASGPEIKPEESAGASLLDLAPTILNLFGYPIPGDMDGEVISPIAPRQPNYSTSGPDEESTGDDDDQQVKERLQQLGYL